MTRSIICLLVLLLTSHFQFAKTSIVSNDFEEVIEARTFPLEEEHSAQRSLDSLRRIEQEGIQGNTASHELEMISGKEPISCTSFLAANGIAVNLSGPNAMQQISASDFDLSNYFDCENIVAVAFSASPTDTERTFSCNDLGNQTLEIYVLDNLGNSFAVLTYVSIQDNLNLCSGNNGTSDCASTMGVYNGLTTALNNQNQATIQANDFIKRLEETCTGDPTLIFENTALGNRSFNANELGIQVVSLQLQLNGTVVNNVLSYINIQAPLTTDGCIPIPVVYNGAATTLSPSGTVQVDAIAFNAASYSDCGGALAFSFSADVEDLQRTFDCSMVGFQTIEIWVTDIQTGTKNKAITYLVVQDFLGACADNECPETYVFSEEETVNAGVYQAADYIHFQNIVDFSETVVLMAGNSISLLPGTHIQANSDFLAKIEDCSTNNMEEVLPIPITQRQQNITTPILLDNQLTVYPNPVRTAMMIDYTIGVAQEVDLIIYDRYGQLVKNLMVGDWQEAGQYTYAYHNNDLSTGMYFVVMRMKDGNRTQKVVVTR